jgi:gentisate 1,2-dioxygenase
VRYLENLHMDPYEGEQQPVREGPPARHVHYRWADSYAELLKRASGEANPFDDVLMEYRDPQTGRSVVPTLGCYLQMLRPGVHTRAHRESSSAVYHVVGGRGRTIVDGVTFDWIEGDFFAIPPRAVHEHANPGAEPAILFSFQDVPLLQALGHYRMDA